MTPDTIALAKTGGTVVDIVLTTTPFAKFIIAILFIFSVISWAIIIRKWLSFRAVRRANTDYLTIFRRSPNRLQLPPSAPAQTPSILPALFAVALREWNALFAGRTGSPVPATVETAMQIVREAMNRRISEELEHYERQLSFLATAGSASPFLGLLGTVWGIMKSFMDIRGLATVNVQTVAPGIADALIVTAAGLFVAIPAVIFYNHFLGQIKDLVGTLERFGSEVESDLRRELLRTGT
jgi:biopolymer transport protein TolQ